LPLCGAAGLLFKLWTGLLLWPAGSLRWQLRNLLRKPPPATLTFTAWRVFSACALRGLLRRCRLLAATITPPRLRRRLVRQRRHACRINRWLYVCMYISSPSRSSCCLWNIFNMNVSGKRICKRHMAGAGVTTYLWAACINSGARGNALCISSAPWHFCNVTRAP